MFEYRGSRARKMLTTVTNVMKNWTGNELCVISVKSTSTWTNNVSASGESAMLRCATKTLLRSTTMQSEQMTKKWRAYAVLRQMKAQENRIRDQQDQLKQMSVKRQATSEQINCLRTELKGKNQLSGDDARLRAKLDDMEYHRVEAGVNMKKNMDVRSMGHYTGTYMQTEEAPELWEVQFCKLQQAEVGQRKRLQSLQNHG